MNLLETTWLKEIWIILALASAAGIFFAYKAVRAHNIDTAKGLKVPYTQSWWFWAAIVCFAFAVVFVVTKGLQ